MSSNMVFDRRRICECEACQAFPAPRPIRMLGKYGLPVAWRGHWWGQTKAGYNRNVKFGGLLHRQIYEAHVGPIPEGFDVHHRDDDKGHNSLSNFELLPHGEHMSKHVRDGRDGFTSFSRYYGKECLQCGRPYRTVWPRKAMYCSGAC